MSVLTKDGKEVATAESKSDREFTFVVHKPDLWSPDSPTLYDLTVKMGQDEVSSYTGFRTMSSGMVNGVQRPLLNGEFIFMFGTLDQGFWPDGIYLAPNKEAMVHDLKMLKGLGFNMLRKHVCENISHVQALFLDADYCHRSRLSRICSTRHVTRWV